MDRNTHPLAVIKVSDEIGGKVTVVVIPVLHYQDFWYKRHDNIADAYNQLPEMVLHNFKWKGFGPYPSGFIKSFKKQEIAGVLLWIEQYFDFVLESRSDRNITAPWFLKGKPLPYLITFRERFYRAIDADNKKFEEVTVEQL